MPSSPIVPLSAPLSAPPPCRIAAAPTSSSPLEHRPHPPRSTGHALAPAAPGRRLDGPGARDPGLPRAPLEGSRINRTQSSRIGANLRVTCRCAFCLGYCWSPLGSRGRAPVGAGAVGRGRAPWCGRRGAGAVVRAPWCGRRGAGPVVRAPWCGPRGAGPVVRASVVRASDPAAVGRGAGPVVRAPRCGRRDTGGRHAGGSHAGGGRAGGKFWSLSARGP